MPDHDIASIVAEMASPAATRRMNGAIDYLRYEGRCDSFLLAYRDETTDRYVTVEQRGYDQRVAGFLTGDIDRLPEFEKQFSHVDEVFDWTEVPGFGTSPTAMSVLRPDGFSNGVLMLLHDDDGTLIGMCHGNVEKEQFPTPAKTILERMRPAFTRYASDLRATSRFRLTARESQILGLVRRGMSNAEIGEELVLSPRTVTTHVEKILRKLDVPNRVMAAVYATELGLGSDRRTVDAISLAAS
ncbi:response regulator transcription factor [Rhodococcoides fascians]|uniref:response regulator transcription factor n=1 Tax=Rhodococcoides fascians TaxID=1828 RepID=UPI00056C2B8A|nr:MULTISPECIES: LuxR C-terminal-related transcriptional regulator [Rhodococcus]OZE96263.1 helix-turn-helix transcriptional regulator [Rhodococcus sp. 15-1189-1-1a]OZF10808.1 helix-turn-helix transcriptional regulator [Rhodococcus sp. 14-2686-1-2]